MGERHLVEVAAGERANLSIEVGADPGQLGLGDPGIGAECFDEVVDLPGRDTMQVGLHHHGELRLVDAAPAFQQRREE